MTARAPMAPYWEGMTEERPATPNMDGISQERIDDAVNALAELVVSTLRSPNPNKFAEAERLCYIGQQLVRTQASTLSKLAEIEEAREPRGEHRPAPVNQGVYGGGIYGGGVVNYGNYGIQAMNAGAFQVVDQVGGGRELIRAGEVAHHPEHQGHHPETRRAALAADPARQVERERAAAEIAAHEGTELAALLALPEPRPVPIITRIATLTASIETRNHAHAQRPAPIDAVFIDPIPVVPAELPRRHLPGENGRDGDPGSGVRANGHGGEGARPFAQAGDQGALLREAMGG